MSEFGSDENETKNRNYHDEQSVTAVATATQGEGSSANEDGKADQHPSEILPGNKKKPPKLHLTTPPSTATTQLRPRPPLECDYDLNVSDLYKLIEGKQWSTILERLEDDSEHVLKAQSCVWVVRKEPNGKLRWRLLPLHAAIIFHAPAPVTEAILEAYPDAAAQKDDQGMLPLHLAFRNGSPWPVLEELLTAFPPATLRKDRKGRTPLAGGLLTTAQNNKEAYAVLQLYSSIEAAAVKQVARQEFEKELEHQKAQLTQEHLQTLQELKQSFYKEKEQLERQHAANLAQRPVSVASTSSAVDNLVDDICRTQQEHLQAQIQQLQLHQKQLGDQLHQLEKMRKEEPDTSTSDG